jgi:hypothetical protein
MRRSVMRKRTRVEFVLIGLDDLFHVDRRERAIDEQQQWAGYVVGWQLEQSGVGGVEGSCDVRCGSLLLPPSKLWERGGEEMQSVDGDDWEQGWVEWGKLREIAVQGWGVWGKWLGTAVQVKGQLLERLWGSG